MTVKALQTNGNKGSLLELTRALLKNKNRELSYNRISKDTGLTVSWLNDFSTRNGDAGSEKVQILYEYLSGKKLELISLQDYLLTKACS